MAGRRMFARFLFTAVESSPVLRFALICGALLVCGSTTWAQFGTDAPTNGPRIDKEKRVTQKIQIGVTITSVGGPCRNLVATAPVPFDWPEQEVQVLKEELSPGVQKIEYRTLAAGVKQMFIHIPFMNPGQEMKAHVTFEVTRMPVLPPTDVTLLSVPKKADKDLAIFLTPSPMIESRADKIVALAKEAIANKESDWEKIEAIYDKMREKIKYQEGPLKGALKALNDGTGDCEEMTSLFVAMCRANGFPARVVWVEGHCYPEFYLVDAAGKGYWIPCQAAGTRSFGGIPGDRVILQKGDNFTDPMRPKEKLRYVSEFLKGAAIKGGGNPNVKFVRTLLGN